MVRSTRARRVFVKTTTPTIIASSSEILMETKLRPLPSRRGKLSNDNSPDRSTELRSLGGMQPDTQYAPGRTRFRVKPSMNSDAYAALELEPMQAASEHVVQ